MNKEINYNYKLPPFKWFCLTNFPFIEADFDALTYYELLCKVVQYLNEVIVKTNAIGEQTEELTNAFNTLKEYVDTYFDNLDVQEEINNKLDAMAEDGTLAEIINQEIFDDLNERLNNVEDLVVNTPEILFGVTFKATGIGQPTELDYAISLDGINFSTIAVPNMAMRDPTITYDSTRKKFYLSCTPATQTEYTLYIYESSDLINWTPHKIIIPNYTENLKGSPDLYYDETNDKLILSFSYQYGTDTDINGDTIVGYDIIFAETTDFTNFTMSNVRVANLVNRTNRNHIDSNIIFINDVWYLSVKDDHSKVVEIYQSTNLTDFSLLCENILNANDENDRTIYLEGACQYVFNNEYHIIADSYMHLHNIVNCKSNDFINFEFATTNLHNFRHGDIIRIKDNEVKKIIANLPNFTLSTTNKLTPMEEYQPAVYIPRNFNGEFTAIPNSICFILGNSTITNIRNPFNCSEQKFAFLTNTNEKLNITKIEDITKNYEILNSTYNNGKEFSISLNKNSNNLGINTFENVTGYSKAQIESLMTDLDSRFTVTDAVGYLAGNTLQLYIELKPSVDIPAQASLLLFRLIPLAPRCKVKIANNLNKNMSIFNNGAVGAYNVDITANYNIELSMTYLLK